MLVDHLQRPRARRICHIVIDGHPPRDRLLIEESLHRRLVQRRPERSTRADGHLRRSRDLLHERQRSGLSAWTIKTGGNSNHFCPVGFLITPTMTYEGRRPSP